MVPLLPKTVILDLLVIFAGKMASIENPVLPTLLLITLYSSQNLFIGIFLEVTKNVRQADVGLVSTYYHVQMIGHQYPRVDIKSLLLLTICKGLNHDMLILTAGGLQIRPNGMVGSPQRSPNYLPPVLDVHTLTHLTI